MGGGGLVVGETQKRHRNNLHELILNFLRFDLSCKIIA